MAQKGALAAALLVLLTLLVIVTLRTRGHGYGRSEGFSWADWGENTSRENYFTGPGNYMFGVGSQHRIAGFAPRGERFSPDAPGGCARSPSRAAQIEYDALRVAAGY